MFDHIGLKVRDLDAAVKFYEKALAPLGAALCCRDDGSAGFGVGGEPALWLLASSDAGTPAHLAFRATDRRAVDGFHAAGAAGGGRDHGKPGLRAEYSPSYYAAFLLDPDGHNVEAVCVGAS